MKIFSQLLFFASMEFDTAIVASIVGIVMLLLTVAGILVKVVSDFATIKTVQLDQEKQLVALQVELAKHKENSDIHFNERVNKQVEEKNTQRFLRLESELQEIKGLVMRLLERKSESK